MTPDEQRALAIECGILFNYAHEGLSIARLQESQLAAYTAAVEAQALESAADTHSAGYVSEARLRKMAESKRSA